MKYYVPVSLSTYTADFDTGLVFPRHGALQFAFYGCFLFSCSFSTACILHTFTIQLRPWFPVEIMINLFKICQVASTKKNGARGESEPMVQSSECLILLMLPLFYSLYTVADINKTFSSISSDFIIYRLFHTCITLIIMSQTQLFCCLYTKKAKFYHTLSDLLWFGFRGFLKHFFLCLV